MPENERLGLPDVEGDREDLVPSEPAESRHPGVAVDEDEPRVRERDHEHRDLLALQRDRLLEPSSPSGVGDAQLRVAQVELAEFEGDHVAALWRAPGGVRVDTPTRAGNFRASTAFEAGLGRHCDTRPAEGNFHVLLKDNLGLEAHCDTRCEGVDLRERVRRQHLGRRVGGHPQLLAQPVRLEPIGVGRPPRGGVPTQALPLARLRRTHALPLPRARLGAEPPPADPARLRLGHGPLQRGHVPRLRHECGWSSSGEQTRVSSAER